jgi:hypothetical protein
MPKRSPQALRALLMSTPRDHVSAGKPQALDDVQPDAAEPEHDGLGAFLDLGGVDDRADAGGDPAANIADHVEGRVLADFRHRDFR